MAYRTEEPPNSRIFIIYQKGITEQEFKESFLQYGRIEDIWIVKDKTTNEERGIAYIKYSKTSEAMLAVEEMNSHVMHGHSKPLKVVVASNRRDGSSRDPREDEKLVRLFVICPKTFTDENLYDEFSKFGEISSVNVIKDKTSGTSKGFGYVKFRRAYQAALAFENCDSSFKPKFAEPQRSRDAWDDNSDNYKHAGAGYGAVNHAYKGHKRSFDSDGPYFADIPAPLPVPMVMDSVSLRPSGGKSPMSMLSGYPVQSGCSRIQIVTPVGLTQGYLTKLFNLIPGLEYCDLNESNGVAFARYSSAQCAAYARDKLNGFEYPIGSQLMVHVCDDPGIDDGVHGSRHEDDYSVPEMRSRAAHILEKAGINPHLVFDADFGNNAMDGAICGKERVNYCGIPLPLVRHLLPSDTAVAQRLFIVCQPCAIPERILRDAFSRFANLIDVFLLTGRNYGYAKFGDKESAMRAIQVLHGQNLSGQRLKVLEAEPPKSMVEEEPTKKQRL